MRGQNRFCAWLHSIIPAPRQKNEEPVEVHYPSQHLKWRADQQRIRLSEAEARLQASRRRRHD